MIGQFCTTEGFGFLSTVNLDVTLATIDTIEHIEQASQSRFHLMMQDIYPMRVASLILFPVHTLRSHQPG